MVDADGYLKITSAENDRRTSDLLFAKTGRTKSKVCVCVCVSVVCVVHFFSLLFISFHFISILFFFF